MNLILSIEILWFISNKLFLIWIKSFWKTIRPPRSSFDLLYFSAEQQSQTTVMVWVDTRKKFYTNFSAYFCGILNNYLCPLNKVFYKVLDLRLINWKTLQVPFPYETIIYHHSNHYHSFILRKKLLDKWLIATLFLVRHIDNVESFDSK